MFVSLEHLMVRMVSMEPKDARSKKTVQEMFNSEKGVWQKLKNRV